MIVFIPGPLPGLNELLEKRGRRLHAKRGAKRDNQYAQSKRAWSESIMAIVASRKIAPVGACAWTWVWIERDRRRDPDNFSSGGRKLILDALKKSGVIEGDGWRHVIDQRDHWATATDLLKVGGRALPGVYVITGPNVLGRQEALNVASGVRI